MALRGGAVDALAWAACSVAAVTLLFSVYLVTLVKARRNEQVISDAIIAMRAALTADPPPQRAILRQVADALDAQLRAAGRVEAKVRDLALRGDQVPRAGDLLTELLSLPEPQWLVADFLREHAGAPGSEAAFTALAADILRQAIAEVFKDLADQGLVELDWLLVLADQGRITNVALASVGSSLDLNPPQRHVPEMADLDRGEMAAIVRSLDRMTRRQLRLITVLHGQAEAILRFPRRGRVPVSLWARIRALTKFPPPVRAAYGADDLEVLALAFDAVGEVVDTAAELASVGRLPHAAHLLAGLRLPVPAGLPGRIYLQESLAQARPLAKFGVKHRLAVCRWVASAIRPQDFGESDRAGWPAGPADPGAGSVDRSS